MTTTIAFTDAEKTVLRTAAYGAVSLVAAAAAADGSPHKLATTGSIALASATGPIGHVLGAKKGRITLRGKTVAAMADQVLPALTEAMSVIGKYDAAEAANFRSIVLRAIDTAQGGQADPSLTEMVKQVTAALDAS